MTDKILSARGEPFKRKGDALNAIKDMPGYHVVEDENGCYTGEKVQSVKIADLTPDYESPWYDINFGKEEEKKSYPTSDVICPGCGQCYHSTTDAYDPERFANPAMIDLKEPWKGWGWDNPVKDFSAGYGCMVCPDCGTALAPSGKLRVK